MQSIKVICILIISVFFINNSAVAQIDTKKIMLDGKEYYLHIVKKGEGLYRIGVNYGVSLKEILQANSDLEEQLSEGQIVRVPVISGRNKDNHELTNSKEYIYHTIEKGQTAFFVSRKYNIALETLYEHNPGTRENFIVGAILKIPTEIIENVETKSRNGIKRETTEKGYILHTVRAKETLYSISRLYDLSVSEIIEDNPALKDGILAIGSQIRINRESVEVEDTVAVEDEQDKTIISDDYIYHLIEPNETFYSISRKYLIEVSDLKEANPNLQESDLKVGYLIQVPKVDHNQINSKLSQQKKNDEWFISHKVAKRETLFAISQKYKVDIDVIKKINATVNFSNLKRGTVLMIPTDQWFSAKALSSEIEKYDDNQIYFSEDDSLGFKECNLNQVIGYQRPVEVALILPLNAAISKNYYSSSSSDTISMSHSMIQIAQKSKAFVEFYSGALLALDKLKEEGVSVNLSVYDIPNQSAISRVVQNPKLKESDLIIGPGLGNELFQISQFSKENQIPLIFPISNNSNNELVKNPYLFQVNSPDSLLLDYMSKDVVNQARGSNIIVILPPDEEKDAQLYLNKIKVEAMKTFYEDEKVNFIEYRMGDDDLISIQSIIVKDEKNFIVVPSTSTSEISKIIPILKGVKEKTRADIRVFGRAEWFRMQTIDPADIHYLQTTIYSPFKLDYKDSQTNKFISKYRQWMHLEPHAISPFFQYSDANSNFSRFGIWGYDVTYYFINALTQYGSDFYYCLDKIEHKEVQFNLKFKRISNWGGYYNYGLNKLTFYPNYDVVQLPLN